MSTITTPLPQAPLRWWKLRLRPNGDGHVMVVRLNADTVAEATESVHEFFDDCDGEINAVSILLENQDQQHILYALAYGPPSDCPRWEPLEKVALYPMEAQPSAYMRDELLRQGIYGA